MGGVDYRGLVRLGAAMTWIQRLLVGAAWGVVLSLLTLLVLTAVYDEPCVKDGIATCHPCQPDGLTVQGSDACRGTP